MRTTIWRVRGRSSGLSSAMPVPDCPTATWEWPSWLFSGTGCVENSWPVNCVKGDLVHSLYWRPGQERGADSGESSSLFISGVCQHDSVLNDFPAFWGAV